MKRTKNNEHILTTFWRKYNKEPQGLRTEILKTLPLYKSIETIIKTKIQRKHKERIILHIIESYIDDYEEFLLSKTHKQNKKRKKKK